MRWNRGVPAVALCLWAVTLPALAAGGGLAEVQKRGKLTMLCWPHQQSDFVRRMVAEHGVEGLRRFTGVDVDILQAYADSLGVALEVRPMKHGFSELIPSLLAGEGDVIGSSLTITEKRREKVDFSLPYHSVQKVVVTRRGSGIRSVADLAGRTAATVAGSSHEEHLLALGIADLAIEHTDFTLENYTAVAEGQADFTVVDSGSAARVLAEHADLATELERAFAFPRNDEYGFAVAPGSDLLASLDAFLLQLRDSGELERIKARHIRRD